MNGVSDEMGNISRKNVGTANCRIWSYLWLFGAAHIVYRYKNKKIPSSVLPEGMRARHEKTGNRHINS